MGKKWSMYKILDGKWLIWLYIIHQRIIFLFNMPDASIKKVLVPYELKRPQFIICLFPTALDFFHLFARITQLVHYIIILFHIFIYIYDFTEMF